MSILSVEKLVKHYPLRNLEFWSQLVDRKLVFEFCIPEENRKKFFAVKQLNLQLEKGECLGVVGQSGSGKTTLIRMIAGLIEPSSGSILLNGKELSSSSRFGRIQMVFQDPTESLNPAFTISRIIADPLICLIKMKDKKAMQARVEELADLVQLPRELLDRYPHQLSGGQKARVGIARALAAEPDIILLDEPTTALDVSVQGRVLLLLDDLRKQLQLSYIFVSHDLSVVKLLCDRLIVMKKGSVVESGTINAVFSSPQHEYTQTLLKSIPDIKNYMA